MKRSRTMRSVGDADETVTSDWMMSAHPGMNPGFLRNQTQTKVRNRIRVESSWKLIGPRSVYFSCSNFFKPEPDSFCFLLNRFCRERMI